MPRAARRRVIPSDFVGIESSPAPARASTSHRRSTGDRRGGGLTAALVFCKYDVAHLPDHTRSTRGKERGMGSIRGKVVGTSSCPSTASPRLPTGSSRAGTTRWTPAAPRSSPRRTRSSSAVAATTSGLAFWPGSEIEPFASFINSGREVRRDIHAARAGVGQRDGDRRRPGRVRAGPEGSAGRRHRRPRQHLGRPGTACRRRRRRTQARDRADDRRRADEGSSTGCRRSGSRRSEARPRPRAPARRLPRRRRRRRPPPSPVRAQERRPR